MSQDGKFWRPGAKTRWHSYFQPRTNIPGVLLFGLIGLLGAFALAVAGWSAIAHGALARSDATLGAVGLVALALGAWQARALARR